MIAKPQSEEHVIFPTGTCFDDTVELMLHVLRAHPESLLTDEFVIVHAIVAPEGRDSAHAWVENSREDAVFFIGITDGERTVFVADRGEYYGEMRVRDVTRYTFTQAYATEKRTGECGPWEERYRQLLRKGSVARRLA